MMIWRMNGYWLMVLYVFFFTKVMDLNIVLKTIEESPLQKPLAII